MQRDICYWNTSTRGHSYKKGHAVNLTEYQKEGYYNKQLLSKRTEKIQQMGKPKKKMD